MAINSKKVIGVVSTLAVVGLTVYAVKKYYDSKKQDEQSIGLDEAKQIVEEGGDDTIKFRLNDDETNKVVALNEEEMQGVIDDSRDTANWNASFEVPNRVIAVKAEDVKSGPAIEDEEEREEAAWYEAPDPQEVQDSKGYFEEDKDVIDDLRYEHNSIEAREQFINMELVVLGRDNDTRDIVSMLYDHPFVPLCDEDENLKVRLIDHRIKFFGMTSKWNKNVTFGDVIMYYGKSAEFNAGNDVRYWVDYFLTCADLNNITLTSDEIQEKICILNAHNFFNEDLQTYSLFGLTSNQMTEAIVVARKRIDARVTYDIEFSQFVQGVIG